MPPRDPHPDRPQTQMPQIPAHFAAIVALLVALLAGLGTHQVDSVGVASAPAATPAATQAASQAATGVSSGSATPVVAAPSGGQPAPTATDVPTAIAPTDTAHCIARGKYPDPGCTPGAVMSTDESQICVNGYTRQVRNVSIQTKAEVYAEYGISSHSPGQYEIDHFIPLELGGSNDLSNLWPQPAAPAPGFHEKDAVENWLHDQACSGHMAMTDAQAAIRTDWVAVWGQMSSANGQG